MLVGAPRKIGEGGRRIAGEVLGRDAPEKVVEEGGRHFGQAGLKNGGGSRRQLVAARGNIQIHPDRSPLPRQLREAWHRRAGPATFV